MADPDRASAGALAEPPEGAAQPVATLPPDAPAAPPPLHASLAAEPWRHGFYQAMRRLEALHRDRPRLGRSTRPMQDPVRLGQDPSVTFAPSTLADFELGNEKHAARLIVHFLGLFGPNGPLPLHLTEYARDRQRNAKDQTFRRFADIFHHRALSLFYRAWADVQPTVSFDRPEDDHYGRFVASLVGIGTPGLRDRDAMPDLAKQHYAGHLVARTRHADGLAAILSDFFRMPARIDTFVGDWLVLPEDGLTRLGGGATVAALGESAAIGRKVWSRQHKFRIVFGPLTLKDYARMLPGGASFRRLVPIVRNYVGDTLAFDVNLILRRTEVPRIQLGRQGQLGWTTWLTPRRGLTDAGDLFLHAGADGTAREADSRMAAREDS
ncbi:type VI secretion system baseplate subunit TssG [Siccirubricoccus sp. KC 17139]|uniref:Type VI secretion system baseplate subunit TssG n=1 Tax=Siccirubricoccus soli TaxID=2899147 RepID=A0ABT1D0S7_9PROT|nr:type VI secretion system baseplate subunit TssG [Siccirubricoccus soli]MCO6415513.1 type VI secretion system baseplate subunit TssG [Siccirubricoccus soli]MCP2681645.1 type VI secretion system baseplate subunit TssG [Siccirubricoccus soli]